MRRADRLLICFVVCLSHLSTCTCVWGNSRIRTVCVYCINSPVNIWEQTHFFDFPLYNTSGLSYSLILCLLVDDGFCFKFLFFIHLFFFSFQTYWTHLSSRHCHNESTTHNSLIGLNYLNHMIPKYFQSIGSHVAATRLNLSFGSHFGFLLIAHARCICRLHMSPCENKGTCGEGSEKVSWSGRLCGLINMP